MSFAGFIKKKLDIAILIALFGFVGNVLAYVYKAAYFFYFKIPFSLLTYTLNEVILFSIGPMILGLLILCSIWITKAPEGELAKIKAKRYLLERIKPITRFFVFIGCLVMCIIQWYITRNLIVIPIALVFGLSILIFFNSQLKDNFKVNISPPAGKKKKKEDRKYRQAIKGYWSKRVKAMKDNGMHVEEMRKAARKENATANQEFDQYKNDFKAKAESLKLLFPLIILIALLWSTWRLGWEAARSRTEFSVIIYQNESYVCLSEYNDHLICARYDHSNIIVPAYRLIPFTDAELIMSKKIGPISITQ